MVMQSNQKVNKAKNCITTNSPEEVRSQDEEIFQECTSEHTIIKEDSSSKGKRRLRSHDMSINLKTEYVDDVCKEDAIITPTQQSDIDDSSYSIEAVPVISVVSGQQELAQTSEEEDTKSEPALDASQELRQDVEQSCKCEQETSEKPVGTSVNRKQEDDKPSDEGDTGSEDSEDESIEFKHKVTMRSYNTTTLEGHVMMAKEGAFCTNVESDTEAESDFPGEQQIEKVNVNDYILDEVSGENKQEKPIQNSGCKDVSSSDNKNIISKRMKVLDSESNKDMEHEESLSEGTNSDIDEKNRNLEEKGLKEDDRLQKTDFTEGGVVKVVKKMECGLMELGDEETERSSEEEEEESENESSEDEGDNIVIVQGRDVVGKTVDEKKREADETSGKERETSEEEEGTSGEEEHIVIESTDGARQNRRKFKQANLDDAESGKEEKEIEGKALVGEDKDVVEEEEEEHEKWSDEDESICGDLEEEDDISEEEENTDFWGDKDDGSVSQMMEVDGKSGDERLKRSSDPMVEDPKMKEEPPTPQETAPDDPAIISQDPSQDNLTEKKREMHSPEKRGSEDCPMVVLQMSPIESGSSLGPQEPPPSPTPRITEEGSVHETHLDSGDETPHSDHDSEDQAWSDSEDNVHSFYD
ncbi:uncharacterized protein O3C94_021757 isoform 2-T2 [Discoglossus pictus]